MVQITKDNAYDAVAPDDFPAMLEVERYGNRSTVFDKIISATNDHFWDPLDKKYIDFDEPFDMENEAIMPENMVGALQTKNAQEILWTQRTPSPSSTSRRCAASPRSCTANRAR